MLKPEIPALLTILSIMVGTLAFCAWMAKCKYTLQHTNNVNLTKIKSNGTKSQKRLAKILENKQQSMLSFSVAETIAIAFFCLSGLFLANIPSNPFATKTAILNYSQHPFLFSIFQILISAFIIFFIISLVTARTEKQKQNVFSLRGSIALKVVTSIFKPLSLSFKTKSVTSNQTNKNISNALDQGINTTGEQEMLRNILTFGDIEVKEIMTPRHAMVGVDKKESFETLKKIIIQSNFSRIPVFEENPDNIYGIIYVKDLLKYVNESEDFYWQKLIKSISFVPENKKISDLLHEFQNRKIHMAAVCDEYGGICGLVTMEDILEEIVGEINDEFDNDETNFFVKIDERNYVFEGKTLLNDFYKITGIEDNFFDEIQGEAESLAGIILELRGEFPAKGETLTYKNLRFKIEQFDNRRIEKIRVHIGKNNKQ